MQLLKKAGEKICSFILIPFYYSALPEILAIAPSQSQNLSLDNNGCFTT
nr:hypothetical protein SHINE37_42715 [Rhizobiaceae bacterium]